MVAISKKMPISVPDEQASSSVDNASSGTTLPSPAQPETTTAPVQSDTSHDQTAAMLHLCREQYKQAALEAKRKGDRATVVKYVKVVKVTLRPVIGRVFVHRLKVDLFKNRLT